MAQLIPENVRSRGELSASVRRVASGLKVALDDDVIVWHEPPFHDVPGKPHFVVLLPDNGIAVLAVADVRPAQLLGVLRGKLRVQRDGTEEEVDDPLEDAERVAAELASRLADEPALAGLRIPVRGAGVFAGLERAAAEEAGLASLPGFDLDRCLFREDVESAVAAQADLHRFFARLLGAADPISGPLVDVVRGVVAPEIRFGDGGQLTIFRAPEGEEIVRVMDLQQERLAKSIGDGHRVIRGVAGSGKTVILVCRARLFAENYPDRKFLLTCYTNTLASQLQVFLDGYSNVEVRTLDSLVTKAIEKARLQAPGYDVDDGEERAKVGLEALRQGALPRYRAVFVDEAQDFGTARLQFAVALADDRYDDVLIVADNAQKVFKRASSWKQAGVQAQGRTRILRRNYRNTREILDFAYALLPKPSETTDNIDLDDENLIVPPEAALRAGAAPALHIRDGDVVRHTTQSVQRLLEHRRGAKEVAVLCVNTSEADAINHSLKAAGVDFFYVTDRSKKGNRKLVGSATEPVILSTVHSAKGLEFPSVILCGTPRADLDVEQLRSILYVGMTRATTQLDVVVDRRHPLADDLQRAAEPG